MHTSFPARVQRAKQSFIDSTRHAPDALYLGRQEVAEMMICQHHALLGPVPGAVVGFIGRMHYDGMVVFEVDILHHIDVGIRVGRCLVCEGQQTTESCAACDGKGIL